MTVWERLRPYSMVAPAIIVFAMFFIYPIFYMMYLSLFDWNFVSPTKTFVGIQNFVDLLSEPDFRQVLSNTTLYTVLTVTLTTGLSLFMAIWLNRSGFFYGLVQGAIFSPHIISLVSISLLWSWLMDPEYGLLNWVIGLFGFGKLEWLSHPSTSLISLVIVAVWKGLGYNTLVFIAGLQSIPQDIYEAASLDRSRPWTTFTRLILPMLSPTIFFLVIINLIGSFQVFETIAIMTQGGPVNSTNTLVYYIYEAGFRFFKIGYASAAGVILLFIVGILTIVYFRLLSSRVHYR
ncbi:ABC transporter permease [Paenibacillus rhizosphaerae]|uniref:ABC transporter permease n=2 Tax=Paenibacillus TaxID=44249 RepID=A0A1R1EAU0_9BACL|nr:MULTISPECIES: sugar ABC transporter permease [Paenibacillus]MBB3130997.1 sn-glycerol 3-phosphate transport system permease protein [Paenibacillus rhizosphaerae]MBJ9989710.1 sugar ABC transporter permease [Paenibacillus sp. S28]MCM3001573.1 sugar ABC transporter permease [Paenibacillus cellulositrophicus]MEC0177778.1 sugar ABC transporter permease [Paenibacillus favisporus]OMF48926.1 ABC transporter permease [Paenibacillus rhizosphaerae]